MLHLPMLFISHLLPSGLDTHDQKSMCNHSQSNPHTSGCKLALCHWTVGKKEKKKERKTYLYSFLSCLSASVRQSQRWVLSHLCFIHSAHSYLASRHCCSLCNCVCRFPRPRIWQQNEPMSLPSTCSVALQNKHSPEPWDVLELIPRNRPLHLFRSFIGSDSHSRHCTKPVRTL